MLGLGKYQVIREGQGQWQNGEYSPGQETTFDIWASIQPSGPKQVEHLPEAARINAKYVVIAQDDQPELLTTTLDQPRKGDRLVYAGQAFAVLASSDWTAHTDGLPHRQYLLYQVGDDE